MVASADLGGFGADAGPPVAYTWVPPSLLPQLLPWLAVLVLLMLRPNRTGQAWWIFAPLACLAAVQAGLGFAGEFLPSEMLDMLRQFFEAIAFGVAAVWVLATYAQHRLRFVAFLKMLGIAVGMSALVFLVRLDWDENWFAAAFLIFVALCGLVTMMALSLAGWLCRRRYRPVRLSLAVALLMAVLWLLISAPFFLLAILAGGGGDWVEFLIGILTVVAATFGTVLPFLILAFAHPFFRARLKQLLVLEPEPLLPPPMPLPPAAPPPASSPVG